MWWRQRLRFGGCSEPVAAGSAPPPPYTASAVHFDGNTGLYTTAMANGIASAVGTYFVWYKGQVIPSQKQSLFALLIGNAGGLPNSHSNSVTNLYISNPGGYPASPVDGPFVFQANTQPFVSDVVAHSDFNLLDESWHLTACSWDLNHATGQRVVQILQDGVLKTTVFDQEDGGAFSIDWTYANFAVCFGWDNGSAIQEPLVGDMSDFYLNIQTAVDLSDSAVVANIISDGKPVFQGADGSLLTGQQPLYYLSGGAATYGTNLGNAGPLSLSGGVLTDATAISTMVLSSGGNFWTPADTFTVDGGTPLAVGVVDTITPAFATVAITGVELYSANTITAVVQGTKTFSVAADITASLAANVPFTVSGSTGNNGIYTVVSAVFGAGTTAVVVAEAIPSATADGDLIVNGVFVLAGNQTASFLAGNWFYVIGSTGNNASYSPPVIRFSGGNTYLYPGFEGQGIFDPTVDGSATNTGAIVTFHRTVDGGGYASSLNVPCQGSRIGVMATVNITVISTSPSD